MSGLLAAPSLVAHASFLEALTEYHDEGMHLDLDVDRLRDVDEFRAWVRALRSDGVTGRASTARDRAPHRILWWTDGARYLGRVRINLELNDELRDFGGHIGYDVRPSARGRGHASAMLAAALRCAAGFGIESALLTCGPENVASRVVIERNGGRFVDVSPSGRLRFLCPAKRPAT